MDRGTTIKPFALASEGPGTPIGAAVPSRLTSLPPTTPVPLVQGSPTMVVSRGLGSAIRAFLPPLRHRQRAEGPGAMTAGAALDLSAGVACMVDEVPE